MIRGLSFEMPNGHGSHLNTILSGILLEKYVWLVSEDDAFTNSENYLFNSDIFTGQAFSEIIATPSYYVFFANIQAYMREDDYCEIDTYADFLRSKCELIIFIIDGIFADIYAKDQATIEIIKKNAEESKFENIRDITDQNDIRTEFSVNGF